MYIITAHSEVNCVWEDIDNVVFQKEGICVI